MYKVTLGQDFIWEFNVPYSTNVQYLYATTAEVCGRPS